MVRFQESFFRNVGGEGEDMEKYFATWSPYRIQRVHVKLVGPTDIYRPVVTLTGIIGTAKLYHFTAEGPTGTKVPKPAEGEGPITKVNIATDNTGLEEFAGPRGVPPDGAGFISISANEQKRVDALEARPDV